MWPLPPEPLSHLPPHPVPPGCHRAPALGSVSHRSNSHWLSILHTVTCMFQSYSLQSSHPPLLPLCAKVSLRPTEFFFFIIKKEERCVSGSRRHFRASKLELFRGRAKEAAANSLWPRGLQHVRLLSPPLSPGVCSNSCRLPGGFRWG